MEFTSPSDFAKRQVLSVQEYSLLAVRSFTNLFTQPRYIRDTLQQMDFIGVGSLPIVVLTGFSIGAVLALNSANALARYGGLSFTGQLVALSMVRELGPPAATPRASHQNLAR
jgi:phospholipid/cholesterol/gamma-HCH transport system permease protein